MNRTTSKDTSCECHSGGGKVVIALHPHNTGVRGHQEMRRGGTFKTKPAKRVDELLYNEYLSCGSFVRLMGVVNAKSLHRLKEITVQVQGRQRAAGQSQVPRFPWTRHRVGLGGCSRLFTPSSLLVWMQHSKMASNIFFWVSWRGKKALAEAQFFLQITPKWRKVVQLLSRLERVLLRKLSRKDNLHLLAKPEQRLSPCHLLLPGQTQSQPTSLSEPWEVPMAVLSQRAAPTPGEGEPLLRAVLPGAFSHSFHLQPLWSAASGLALSLGMSGHQDCSLLPSHVEVGSLVGASVKESELLLLTLCSG